MSTALMLGILAFGVACLVAYLADEIIASSERRGKQVRTLVLTVSTLFVAAVMTLTGAWFGHQDGYRQGFDDSTCRWVPTDSEASWRWCE